MATRPKKIMVDECAMDLIGPLRDMGLSHVKDVSALGLDPNQGMAGEAQRIHRGLKKLAKATPNSNYVLLTRRGEAFVKPDGYDVVWLPRAYKPKALSDAFAAWVAFLPKRSANAVFRVKKTRSKYGRGFEFAVERKTSTGILARDHDP